MTLTSDLRAKFPKRYVRKDARTYIYGQLFGFIDQSHGRPDNGIPEINESRIRASNKDMDWAQVKQSIMPMLKRAAFSQQRLIELIAYFDRHVSGGLKFTKDELEKAFA